MFNKLSFQSCLLLIIALLANAAFAGNKITLTQQINKAIADEKLAGITWSTVSNGTVQLGSAGFSNTSKNKMMRHDQKMHVGSVTKTVLSLATLRLITQGELTLDTEVAALLPNITFNNPWSATAPIRVRNLLEHTAGLDNIRIWQFLNTTATPNTPLEDAFPATNNKLLTVRSKPGSQYSYSNMGYALLAMVIESISSQRYEDYLDAQFLQKLGMKDSTFKYVSQTGEYADERLSMGYFEDNVAQTAVPIYLRPAGQFTTTASDMAQFIQLIFNKGMLNGQLFIRPDLMTMLGSPEQTEAAKVGLKMGHGLAFSARDRHDVVGMCHPGTTFGFRAYICLFPKQSKAFFYSINTDSETADYEKFNSIFINHLSIGKASTAEPSDEKMDLSALEGLYLPAPNNMAEFEWLDLMFNFKWLTQQDNTLVMKSTQSNHKVLIPLNKHLLRSTDRTQASHAIITHGNDVYISNGLSTYKQQPIFILAAYWLSLVLGLFGLTYIVLVAIVRIITGKIKQNKLILGPFLNILALSIPLLMYTQQSFLNFGELTAASFLMAVISALIPVTLVVSLLFAYKKKLVNKWIKWDCAAILMLLQLSMVLVYWQVFPVIFWR